MILIFNPCPQYMNQMEDIETVLQEHLRISLAIASTVVAQSHALYSSVE